MAWRNGELPSGRGKIPESLAVNQESLKWISSFHKHILHVHMYAITYGQRASIRAAKRELSPWSKSQRNHEIFIALSQTEESNDFFWIWNLWLYHTCSRPALTYAELTKSYVGGAGSGETAPWSTRPHNPFGASLQGQQQQRSASPCSACSHPSLKSFVLRAAPCPTDLPTQHP